MTVAEIVAPLVRAALGDRVPIRIRCWDRSENGPEDAPLRLNITRRRALRRILWSPNELGFARAYVSGDVDVDGDLMAGLEALEQVALAEHGAGVVVDATTKRALLKAALKLGIVGVPPKPPAEEARLVGRRHSKNRDAHAISHHYDLGNEFYRIVLGDSMTYSCRYCASEPGPSVGLTQAQFAKCDLVARKLGLTRGMRVLDVGSGWGTFALHAASTGCRSPA
jgi:cyclopropane-fatty-acyl-phospholipid synthase